MLIGYVKNIWTEQPTSLQLDMHNLFVTVTKTLLLRHCHTSGLSFGTRLNPFYRRSLMNPNAIPIHAARLIQNGDIFTQTGYSGLHSDKILSYIADMKS